LQLQGKLNHLRFTGCIEDVKYDGAAVGLWDFVKAQNNKNRACKARYDYTLSQFTLS